MARKLLLLQSTPYSDASDFADIWWKTMKEDLVLTTQGRQDALLVILNRRHDANTMALAGLLENMDDTPSFDSIPLFILWDDTKVVQEYAPFENSVRQLVKQY